MAPAARAIGLSLLVLASGIGTPLLYMIAFDSYDLRPATVHREQPAHDPHHRTARNLWIHADPASSHFIDEYGRVRLFHGLNVVFKTPPHIPDPGEWDAETSFGRADAANLSEWGFNAIRLGVLWAGTYPARRGVLDDSYVEKVKAIVRACADYGIYVVLDMHSDVLSRRFCGNGMPDWAVDDALHASGMQPPYGDFPAPLLIPQTHFFGRAAHDHWAANRSSCAVHATLGTRPASGLGGNASVSVGVSALEPIRGERGIAPEGGGASDPAAQSAAAMAAPVASAASLDGWCAEEIVTAVGASTSTEVAAILEAAGYYPRLEACLERDFFGYYYTNVSTKTAQVSRLHDGGILCAPGQSEIEYRHALVAFVSHDTTLSPLMSICGLLSLARSRLALTWSEVKQELT